MPDDVRDKGGKGKHPVRKQGAAKSPTVGCSALTSEGGAVRTRRGEQREHTALLSLRRMKHGDLETRLSSFHLARDNES